MGTFRFQSTVPCHIKVVHWVFKHTTQHFHTYVWATCRHWLSSGTTPLRGYRRASPYLWGRVDVHHFGQQQERGYTTKVDSSWSVLHYVLVRCPLPPTQSMCVCVGGWVGCGGYFALLEPPWVQGCPVNLRGTCATSMLCMNWAFKYHTTLFIHIVGPPVAGS